MIATPGRYAKNGKRHKKQNASKKAAMVCAWVPGRGCGGVGGVGLRVNVTDSEPIGIYWAIAKPPFERGLCVCAAAGVANFQTGEGARVFGSRAESGWDMRGD